MGPQQMMRTIDNMVDSVDVTTSEALSEVFELVSYILMKLLGPLHKEDIGNIIEILTGVIFNTHELFTRVDATKVKSIMNNITQIVSILKGCVKKRQNSPIFNDEARKAQKEKESINAAATQSATSVSSSSRIRKSVSTGFLQELQMPSVVEGKAKPVVDTTSRLANMTPFRQEAALID